MSDTDNRELRALLADCKGNMREAGSRLGITKQAACLRVKKAGLTKFAASLRAMHGVKGTRVALADDPASKAEADEVRAALAEHKTQSAAARALGWGRTRLQRAMKAHGIA